MAQNAELPPGAALNSDRHAHLVPNVFRALYDPVLNEPVPPSLIDAAMSELDRIASTGSAAPDGEAAKPNGASSATS